MVFELPFATESLNTLMGWKHNPRTRQWKYGRYKRDVADALNLAIGKWVSAPVPMRVTVTRYSPGTLDDMNLRGGCKPLIDALVDLGVLVDDSPEWLRDDYRQVKTKRGDKRTRIEIEEA